LSGIATENTILPEDVISATQGLLGLSSGKQQWGDIEVDKADVNGDEDVEIQDAPDLLDPEASVSSSSSSSEDNESDG
jgi:hypothetical protein